MIRAHYFVLWERVSMSRCIHGLLASTLIAVSLAGCSDDRLATFPVSGKVVFKDGSPVRMGTVELKSREHAVHARGEIDSDGRFELTTFEPGDGAVAGQHNCVIVQLIVAEDLVGHVPSTDGVVHPRFASYHTSRLTCEIQSSTDNNITLEVEPLGNIGARSNSSSGEHHHHHHDNAPADAVEP